MGAVRSTALAGATGTPVHVLDEADVRAPGQCVYLRVACASAGREHIGHGVRLGSSTALAALKAVLPGPNLVLAGLDCSSVYQLSRFGAFERLMFTL